MSINTSSNFKVGAALPADDKIIAADITARDAIPPIQRYIGMLVTVQSPLQTWQLGPGLTNADWVIFGGTITGSGLADSVAYWQNSTNIICDAFFRYPAATEILQTKRGMQFYEYGVSNIRYIDPLGSNSNDGLTPLTPWADPQYAVLNCLSVGPGKYQIIPAPGTYNNVSLDIPEYLGRDAASGSLIEILGDETTPANVVFDSSFSVVNHNAKNTALRLAGIRFTGSGSNYVILQNSGVTLIRNCECDTFLTFALLNNGALLYTEAGRTLTLADTFNAFYLDNGSKVINDCSININPPNNSQPCNMFTTYNSSVICGTGSTYNISGAPITGSGYHFKAVNSYIYCGTFGSFTGSTITGFCDMDGISYLDPGLNNSIVITGADNICKVSGQSFLNDGPSTTWNFNSVPASGVILKSGGVFRSPAVLHSGLLILDDIIKYVTITNDDNYTRYALDKRYTQKVSFSLLGKIPQGYNLVDIGPQGVSSNPQILHIATGNEQITNLTIRTRLATGFLLPDIYTIYVNGIASSLSVTIVNSNSGSSTGLVNLVAGDVVTLRFSTSILSQAEDLTAQFTLRVA